MLSSSEQTQPSLDDYTAPRPVMCVVLVRLLVEPHLRRSSMSPTPSPSPRVIELEARETRWEISPGRAVAGYGYNGQVPGPVIEARQGEALEIRFTNRLPEPTLIHWHGLRVPP